MSDINPTTTPHAWTEAVRVDGIWKMDPTRTVNWGTGDKVEINQLAAFLFSMKAVVDLIATKVDITAEELAQIEEAARQGALAGAAQLNAQDIVDLMTTDPAFKAAVVEAMASPAGQAAIASGSEIAEDS